VAMTGFSKPRERDEREALSKLDVCAAKRDEGRKRRGSE
jgi:hypothetical protein